MSVYEEKYDGVDTDLEYDGIDLSRIESEDDYVCELPGECIMPYPHMRSECHTAEMLESFNAEVGKIE